MKHLMIIALLAFGTAVSAQQSSDSYSESDANSASLSGSIASINNYGSDSVTYSGSYEVKNAPAIGVPSPIHSAPCMVAVSGGFSVVGGGASFGGGTMDHECNVRAEAAALAAVGGTKLAIAHLASDPSMCVTMRGQGVIAANSVCTAKEKLAAAKAAQTVSTKSATRSVARPTGGYSKCEMSGNKVRIRYEHGANKALAKSACLASLGY